MAIFPRAQGALSRPGSRFPRYLLVAILATAAAFLANPLALYVGETTDARPSLVSETSSLAATTTTGSMAVPPEAGASPSRAATAAPATFDVGPEELAFETSSLGAYVTGQSDTQEPAAVVEEAASTSTTLPATEPDVTAPLGPIDLWAEAGIIIATDGQSLDEYSLANVDAALRAIPVALREQLGNPALGPLHILVNSEGRTLSGAQPYRGPANFFSTNDGANELVLFPQQSTFTIIHELGHAYNLRTAGAGRYATVLLEPEMHSFLSAAGWEIMSSEAEVLAAVDHMHVDYTYSGSFSWSRVSNDDPLEDFANSFAMFLLDPEALAQLSPERHDWMTEHLAR